MLYARWAARVLLSLELQGATAGLSTDSARKVTVPVHSGNLKRGTLRSIIAQAGLTVAEFSALL